MVDPTGLGRRLRVALVPVGFVAGAFLSRIWLWQAPSAYAVDLAQPLVVVTYWQHFGFLMWIALFVAVTIASVGYIARLRMTNGTLPLTTLFSALACIAALAFPVVFSSDVYAYAGYGWLALHGASPYAHAAITTRNPLLDAVVWQWGNPPPVCVYGPAFVWFSEFLVAVLQHLGPSAPLWGFRIAACAALVLCAPLAYAAFSERARSAAAAGIALNPIAIWSCAEGHNDIYVIAVVLAGFALIRRSRAFTGAALLALSALVKVPGLIAAGAAAIAYAREARFGRVISGVIAGTALCALAGWPALAQLTRDASQAHYYFPQFSLQYVFAWLLGDSLGIVLTAVIIATCFVLGAILAMRRNENSFLLLALALWLAIPNPYPWYALWILPLAFIRNGAAQCAIVALTLGAVLRYLPDSTTDVSSATAVFVALAPLAAAAAVWGLSISAGTRRAAA